MLIAIAVRTVSFRRSGLLYPFLNWEYAARICGVMTFTETSPTNPVSTANFVVLLPGEFGGRAFR